MSLFTLFLFLLQLSIVAQRYEVKMLTPTTGLSENRFDSTIDITNNGRVLMYSNVSPTGFNLSGLNASDKKDGEIAPHHKIEFSDEILKHQKNFNRLNNTPPPLYFYCFIICSVFLIRKLCNLY